MHSTIPERQIWYQLIPVWIILGFITHLSAILWMLQYEETISLHKIIDVGFYYHIPSFLWIIYTPWIIRFYIKNQITGPNWQHALLLHIGLSILLAPLARANAIFIDYAIKYLIGMESQVPWEIVYSARFIVIGSAPKAFLFYWIVIGSIIAWQYFLLQKNKTSETPKKQLVVNTKVAKKIIGVDKILWIEANGNYVNVHTQEETYRLRKSLSNIRAELDEQQFLQVHRSKIINKTAIESLSHWRRGEYLIRLKNNKLLSSSRTYHQNIQFLLGN